MNANLRSMVPGSRYSHRVFSIKIAALTLVELLVVVAIIGLVIALLLPTTRGAREAARRNQCQGKLSQIATALQNYQDIHGSLPPAYTTDADGKPLHSWRTLILPFMEHVPLYESIDLSKPWDDPANAEAFKTVVEAYQCPSADIEGNLTTYLAVVTPSSAMRAAEGRKPSEFRDLKKPRLTIIEVDADHAVPWMSPTDADESLIRAIGRGEVTSHHPGVTNAAFSDGSTYPLGDETTEEGLLEMISVDAGIDVETGKPAEEPTRNN